MGCNAVWESEPPVRIELYSRVQVRGTNAVLAAKTANNESLRVTQCVLTTSARRAQCHGPAARASFKAKADYL